MVSFLNDLNVYFLKKKQIIVFGVFLVDFKIKFIYGFFFKEVIIHRTPS